MAKINTVKSKIVCNFDLFYSQARFKWSFDEVAGSAGITRNHLYYIRLGRLLPRLDVAARLCNILNYFYRVDGEDIVIHLFDLWPFLLEDSIYSRTNIDGFLEEFSISDHEIVDPLSLDEYRLRGKLDG